MTSIDSTLTPARLFSPAHICDNPATAFMRDTRLSYFLTLAMLGTVLPYASVFFLRAGLSNTQVGYAYAIYGLASVLSPAIVTLLADRKGDPRQLLAALCTLAGAFLLLLSDVRGVLPVLTIWTLYCLASVAVFPLLNGIHFSQQQRRREAGETAMPFHLVRVWGSIGYIAISLLLFPLLQWGMSLRIVLITGGICAGLAAVQAVVLHDPRKKSGGDEPIAENAEGPMPSFHAARALLGRRLFAFTIAVVLMSMTSQVQAAFYPVYLTDRVHLAAKWLGQASNVAVFVEIFLIFGCGWLVARFGIKRLLMLCMLGTAGRMAMLGLSHNVPIAIGSQVLHGLLVLAIGVLPQALFDEHASERFRHSMQGMLVMLISAGQCLASFTAGFIAAHSLPAVYGLATGLCLAAVGLVWVGFHEMPKAEIVHPLAKTRRPQVLIPATSSARE